MDAIQIIDHPPYSLPIPSHPCASSFTPEIDTRALLWLASLTSGNIAEIGCNRGLTTMRLARANPRKMVYGIDCSMVHGMVEEQWNEAPGSMFGICAASEPNVTLLHCSSRLLDFDSELNNVTMIFIDGDHSYDGVRIDTTKSLNYLRQQHGRRFIVWHDYHSERALTLADSPTWLGVGPYIRNHLADFGPRIYEVRCSTVVFAELSWADYPEW